MGCQPWVPMAGWAGALGSLLTLRDKDGFAPVAPVAAPVLRLLPELDLEGSVSPQVAGHWDKPGGWR